VNETLDKVLKSLVLDNDHKGKKDAGVDRVDPEVAINLAYIRVRF
jgi:hypothetical protein